MQVNLLKIAVAVLLMLLAGGAWLALDYMNRQEQLQAKALQSGLMQAKLEAQNRTRTQNSFEEILNVVKTSCETAADKAHEDYFALIQKQMPVRRNVHLPVPQPVVDEATTIATTAKAGCNQLLEALLKNRP